MHGHPADCTSSNSARLFKDNSLGSTGVTAYTDGRSDASQCPVRLRRIWEHGVAATTSSSIGGFSGDYLRTTLGSTDNLNWTSVPQVMLNGGAGWEAHALSGMLTAMEGMT